MRSGMILDAEPDLSVAAEAAAGSEALAVLQNTPVDLAILDIAVPPMTGLQAAREINRSHPHVRIGKSGKPWVAASRRPTDSARTPREKLGRGMAWN